MNVVTEKQDSVTVAKAAGRLDFGSASEFQTAMEALFAAGNDSGDGVVVDCEALEYVSSAGLRVFLICARLAKQENMGFAVCNLSPLVLEVFEISGFGNVLTICEDLDAGIAAAKTA